VTWSRVDARREAVRRLVNQLRCVTAGQLSRRLGLSRTQAAYTLRTLERLGAVVRYDIGVHVWCIPSASEGEVYTAVSPCFKHVDEAFRKIVGGARGRLLTLTPGDLVKAMARLYRRDCSSAAGSPYLLAAARRWLERYLDGAILTRSRSEWRYVKYVIDVKKAREKLGYV